MKKKDIEELKRKRMRKKAKRNEKKCFASTKSFNKKDNNFIPEVKEIRNPNNVLYLSLKNKGSLRNVKGKPITYKQWQDDLLSLKVKTGLMI